MRLVALGHAARLLEAALPDSKIRELAQRPSAHPAVAALEGAQRNQQLFLRFAPAADRDQDASVVCATDRRDEVAPGAEAARHRHPLLGAGHVQRGLAGAQQPAVDVADGNHADDLAG